MQIIARIRKSRTSLFLSFVAEVGVHSADGVTASVREFSRLDPAQQEILRVNSCRALRFELQDILDSEVYHDLSDWQMAIEISRGSESQPHPGVPE
jgi:hypothetical protein